MYFNYLEKVWWFFFLWRFFNFKKKKFKVFFRMVPQRKHARKAWMVSNIIEEQVVPNEKQVIIVYVAPHSQGMSWEVHFEFAYGHVRTHPCFPCKNKDGLFFVNFICCNTWMFLIKFLSHNRILSWFLVHNTFIFFYLKLWFNAIPSYCWHCGDWPRCNPHYVCWFSAILSFFTIVVVGLGVISHYVRCFGAIPSSCFMLWWLAQMKYLQYLYQILHLKRFLVQFKMSMEMQWKIMHVLMKAQDGVARWMHALVFMRPNGYSVSTWSEHTPFKCRPGNQSFHLLILGSLSNRIMVLWMLVFWATHMEGKSKMRRRPLIECKRK
jgi:hypothetical protein